MTEFLEKWHAVCEEDVKERARLMERLQRAIQESRAIRELAGNPLLLTMMAILNRNQELPRDRVELYREASRVLLHEWDASRSLPVDVFGRQEKEALLRELAGTMQQGDGGLAGNLIEEQDLLNDDSRVFKNAWGGGRLREGSQVGAALDGAQFHSVLCGAGRFSFVHRTFLEYYCAAWFVYRFEKERSLSLEGLITVFEQHWRDETWHEVLRLIAGMVGEKQAEQLIRFLMEQDGRADKLVNLMLAAGCLSEVRNRRLIAGTDKKLFERMLKEAVRYEPLYYYEDYEAETEIGPTRTKAVGLIAKVWRAEAGVWLQTAVGDENWIVRRAAVRELARGWQEDAETLPSFKGARPLR